MKGYDHWRSDHTGGGESQLRNKDEENTEYSSDATEATPGAEKEEERGGEGSEL